MLKEKNLKRFKGRGPCHFSSQLGVAQGSHRRGVGGSSGGMHLQDLQGLPPPCRGRHRRRRGHIE